MKPTKKIIWGVSNFVILGTFILGNQFHISFLKTIGEIGLWFAALIGTTLAALLSYFLYHGRFGFKYLTTKRSISPEEEKAIKKKLKEKYFFAQSKNIQKNIDGSVPQYIDILFDFVVCLLMIHYGYLYLTVFYMIHMVGLALFKDESRYFRDTAVEYNPIWHDN